MKISNQSGEIEIPDSVSVDVRPDVGSLVFRLRINGARLTSRDYESSTVTRHELAGARDVLVRVDGFGLLDMALRALRSRGLRCKDGPLTLGLPGERPEWSITLLCAYCSRLEEVCSVDRCEKRRA